MGTTGNGCASHQVVVNNTTASCALLEGVHRVLTCGNQSLTLQGHTNGTLYPKRLQSIVGHRRARNGAKRPVHRWRDIAMGKRSTDEHEQ